MKPNKRPLVSLSIETSCDDTSVALVDSNGWVIGQATAHQDLVHEPFGGVVPEIAGRSHLENLLPLVDQLFKKTSMSWSAVGGISVTNRPGLIGSLIVGLVTAKSLALAQNKPFIGIHHIEGHILSAFLSDQKENSGSYWKTPFLALAVSGGHSHLYRVSEIGSYQELGKTIDDAAGEAFDKFAKILGLGYPGGVLVDQWARKGDAKVYDFPRSFIKEDNYNFSFSGLKSSAHRLVQKIEGKIPLADLCASYQEAIVDVLVAKLFKAAKEFSIDKIVIVGGVSANSRLRTRATEMAQANQLELKVPSLKYCTDNAAMIGLAGAIRLEKGEFSEQNIAPKAREVLS